VELSKFADRAVDKGSDDRSALGERVRHSVDRTLIAAPLGHSNKEVGGRRLMNVGTRKWMRAAMCAATLSATALGSTGCQISVGGQTLPSPYYIEDDVQYFAPGPEFKLSREAAAQKAFNAEQRLEFGGAPGGAAPAPGPFGP
jgi:hypothetical protein